MEPTQNPGQQANTLIISRCNGDLLVGLDYLSHSDQLTHFARFEETEQYPRLIAALEELDIALSEAAAELTARQNL